MSILQVEISEKTMRQLEAWAAARNLNVQSWMREQIETVLVEDKNISWEQEKLLESLDSPVIEATPEWWESTIRELNDEANARREKQAGEMKHAA